MFARSISTSSISTPSRFVSSWWNRRSTATGLALALFAGSVSVAVVGNSSASFAVPPAEVSQLANVTNDNNGSDPAEMTLLGNKIIYRACDDDRGCELWVSNSDGTDPKILKDINPDGGSGPYGFTVVGDIAYFSADNGVNGQELWKTNGTADGTTLIHDIYPGGDSSSPNTFKSSGSLVFFFATDASGNSVWVTSGTTQSTRKVGGIEIATQASNPYNIVQLNGLTYFRADNGVNGHELWVSDGTPQGSRMIKDVNPGSSGGVDSIYSLGGRIFFRGNDGVRGWELWTTDGTEVGTMMLKNINPNGDAGVDYLTYAGDKWFFRAQDLNCCDALSNGKIGFELYVTDGTTTGTRLVKDISTNAPTNICWWCNGPTNFKALTNGIIFQQDDGVHGNIWYRSDGTTAGTTSLDPDLNDLLSNNSEPIIIDNKAYFLAGDATNGLEPWVTDGSPTGTRMLANVNTNNQSSNVGNMTRVGTSANYVFSSNDGIHGEELWVTDFTDAGTRMVRELQTGTENSAQSSPHQFYAVGDKVFFRAFSDATGWEMWVTDGTSIGTRALDLNPGRPDSAWDQIYGLNSKIVFRRHTEATGYEPWISDGTISGTRMIKEFNPSGDSTLELAAESNGKIYLKINDQTEPGYTAVWVTDGTSANTTKLTSRCPNNGNPDPTQFTPVAGGLLFKLSDCQYNHKWWRTDGTAAGTTRLDVTYDPLTTTYGDVSPVVIGDKYYYTMTTPEFGTEIWITDGSPTGTRVLKDINTVQSGSNSGTGVKLGNKWIFNANDGINGDELWVSDGTVSGTRMVRELQTGSENSKQSSPSQFVLAGDKVFFRAFSDATGWDLWVTDGTSAGTRALNLNPGRPDSYWDQTYALNGKLVFRNHNYDYGFGVEPWISDGTVSGTRMIKDFNTSGDSSLELAAESNGKIYLKINDQSSPSYTAVWVTDGTSANTIKLTSRCPNNGNPDPNNFRPVAGGLLMALSDCAYNHKWWRTDGTLAGTARLDLTYDPLTTTYGDVNPIAIGNKYYYTMTTREIGTEIWITDGSPSGTRVLKDINTAESGSGSGTGVKLGNKWIFNANDGINGDELWVSDGTVSGTRMVRELQTGSENGKQSSPSQFVLAGNKVFFRAFSDATGWDLWVTDGTSAGTRSIDLNPGRPDSYWDQTYALDGKLVFRNHYYEYGFGVEPWISDGTVSGTRMIKDFNPSGNSSLELAAESNGKIYLKINDQSSPGYTAVWVTDGTSANTVKLTSRCANDGNPDPSGFTPVAGGLLMRLTDCVYGSKWWRTDGTIAGTSILNPSYDAATTQYYDVSPYQNGGKYYFNATTKEFGNELWVTDGSPTGTFMVKDINTGNDSSIPSGYFKVGNKYFYQASDGINGNELWVTDGTVAGTRMLKNFNSTTQNSGNIYWSGTFYKAGNRAVFAVNDLENGYQLWASDGTELGTVRLTNTALTDTNYFDSFNAVGSKWIFRARTTTERNLWITDGTTAGTFELMNITSGDDTWESFLSNGNSFVMRALSSLTGPEPLYSDGTVAGTRLLDLNAGSSGSLPSSMEFFGNKVVFYGQTSSGQYGWHYTDGTVGGTAALDPDTSDSAGLSASPVVLGNKIYYIATDADHGAELWKSDGTAAGTALVQDIRPGTTGSAVNALYSIGSKIYFGADDGTSGSEPWVSDGTEAGTQMMVDVMPGQPTSGPSGFFGFANKIMFLAQSGTGIVYYATDATSFVTESLGYGQCNGQKIELDSRLIIALHDPSGGCEPAVTNGTTEGTFFLGDLYPGGTASSPTFIAATPSKVYFLADDGTYGRELWVTDGTIVGTQRLSDFIVGSGSPPFTNFNVVGEGIWFQYCTCNNWVYGVSDGTVAGTHALDTELPTRPSNIATVGSRVIFSSSDIVEGTELWSWSSLTDSMNRIEVNPFTGSGPGSILTDGTTAIFSANDSEHGHETWISDGTSAGTRLFADSNALPQSSSTDSFFSMNGVMYFRAIDFDHGRELWKTDGTSAGTVLVKDINPGVNSSDFGLVGQVGNIAYFTATATLNGNELWMTDGTAIGTRMIKDINTNINSSRNAEITYFYADQNGLFFKAYDGTTRDLWTSDGTSGGTKKIDIRADFDDDFDYGTIAGSKFYFRSRDDLVNNTGHALYVADRDSGVVTKLMTMTGYYNEYPYDIRAVGNSVVFAMYNAPSPDGSWQYWMSNGTTAGTRPFDTAPNDKSYVQSIYRFGNNVAYRFDDGVHGNEWRVFNGTTGVSTLIDLNPYGSANIASEFVDGNTLRFRADDGIHGDEWWVSDGTIAGTRMYSDVNTTGASSSPDQFTVMNGVTYFRATNSVHGAELWKTDGTTEGTVFVKDIYPGSIGSNFALYGVMGNKLFLSAKSNDIGESEPWVSDGTTNGTILLKDINTTTSWSGGSAVDYVQLGTTRTYFRAYDGMTRDYWVTDGTTGGTTEIDLIPGADDYFDYTTVAGSKFYFRYRDNIVNGTGNAYYVSDGTPGNMTKLMTLSGHPDSYDYPNDPRQIGNTFIFQLYNYPTVNNTWQWWTSNGTSSGTQPLDTVPSDNNYPGTLYQLGSNAMYRFDNGVNGNEWWVLNGTTGVSTLIDLNPYGSANIDSEFVDGNTIRFRADDGAHGLEWWVSDGTVAGTRMYSDANTSGASSSPDQFTVMNGVTYFRATNSVYGAELWKTDGTTAGTALVKDIYPGSSSSNFALYGVMGNKLFLSAKSSDLGESEPWISDGTTNGTVLLKDINTTTNGSGGSSVESVTFGTTRTYFRAYDGTTRDFWETDGTSAGTTKVDLIPVFDDYVDSQTVVGNKFYFRYRDNIANGTGSAYYVSDGTPGNLTKLVTMSDRPNAYDYPNEQRALGNTLLFRWYNYPTVNSTWQWWMSDGTSQGTVPLDSILTDMMTVTDVTFIGNGAFYYDDDGIHGREWWLLDGATGVRSRLGLRNVDQVVIEGSRIRFRADDGVHGLEYWTSDGTLAGTQMVQDINPIGATSNATSFVKMGGNTYFIANDATHPPAIWRSDGTAIGTSAISNIALNSDWYEGQITNLVATSNQLFFTAVDPIARKELFVSDGTLAGTHMVKDINPENGWCWWCIIEIENLKVINNKVVFRAGNSVSGREMWVSDGTANGTFMLEDSNPGPTNSDADQFTVIGNKLFYRAYDASGNYRLHSTDGTVAGTHTINYRSDNGGASGINDFRAVGNNALLMLENGVYGWQWWFSDGTNSGTYLLDPYPTDGSWPELVTVSGDKVFFRTHDTNNDRELYVADSSGVTRLGNIRTTGSSEPDQLIATSTGVVFTAEHDFYGREPWITDGTVSGTRLLADVNTRAGTVSFDSLTSVNGKIIYRFNDNVRGWQIVASDGTSQGTGFAQINSSGTSDPSELLSLGSRAVFNAVNAQGDRQLYVSDGTAVGTTVILDINSLGNDNVGNMALINGVVYFGADDGVNGREMWVTDGTVGGTRMLLDLNTTGSSDPYSFTLSNGKIYFTASDGIKGREPYVTDGTAVGTISLGDLNPYGDSNGYSFTAAGTKTVFNSYDPQRGWELWVTDGTAGETQILADLNPNGDSYPQSFTSVNGKAVFSATDGTPSEGGHGREAWVTDGTLAGTQLIEINTSATVNSGNGDPYNFTVLGNRVLFSAYNSSRLRELWVTDGTSVGTRMYDLNTFGGGITNNPVGAGSNMVWSANDGLQADGKHGDELWVSNGTAAGTSLVDINQASWYNGGNSYPSGFTKNGNLTFFSARNATNGNELWQTDGTAAGSTLAADINPNTENSNADSFMVVGNRYYFRAYTQQFGWELYTSTSATGSATLVKDIRVEGDSWPDSFTASGNKMFFRADDGINGREIWVTDGTAAGTRMVKNICPTSNDCGSWIQSEVNGEVLFYANDLVHGYQPYLTDGTAAGTQSLDENLNDGSNAENPVVLGNKIIYIWDDGISGREMWSYNVTTKSRAIFKDIQVGAAGSSVDSLVKFGNYLYFRANNGTDGIELWRTDGTVVGTNMVANTHPTGDGNPDYFFQVGSKIFFRSEDGVNGRTLWVTNGTSAGTLQVSTSTSAETFAAGTTKLFYRSYDATNGWELWVSDGTPAGTRLTKDLNNSSGDTWMDSFTTSGDQLYFRANNGVTGYELATSDGTEAGTFMLGDFNTTGDSWPDSFVPMGNGKLLFRVDDGTVPSHRNLWVSDGTIAGTRAITSSYVGANVAGAWSASPWSVLYLPSTGKAYFSGWDMTHGFELWTTDGTVTGTQMVKDINTNGDSTPDALTVVGDKILMRAFDGSHGQEPWISDGTAAGTIALGDLNTVGASSDPGYLTKTTNRMFFSADDWNHGRELWVKDANGTRMVADKGLNGYGYIDYITALGDNVVYRYNDGIHGNELWFSDGTANGTIRLTNAVTNGDSNPEGMTSFGNKVIFRMYDPTNGWELWITDGTLSGTTLLKDIRSGGDSFPSDFTMVGSKMFFTADDGVLGRQLWVTDGTTSGTIALPANTSGNSNVSYLTVVGSTLYFSADDGVNGYELWKSDGTVGGTTMVKDIRTGALSSSPQQFTVSGSTLYFTATDDTRGRELWKSNGTSIGTTIVSDINPYGNSHPEQLVVDGSLLYFAANDGVSGRELFVSDGTAVGTGSIDINRSGGSRPERLARNNNILYFTANDGFNGNEMWSVNGGWLASTAPNVTRSENAPLPPSGVTRPVPATLPPVLTSPPSTTQAPSVPTSAPETSSPGSSNPNSSIPEPTLPNEVPTTGSETSAPSAIIPNTAPRVLTPPPAGSSSPSIMPVAEARQMEQERGQVTVQFNGEAVEVSQFRITGSGISSDQRDRSPGVIAEIRAQARQLVAAFDSFLPSGVTSEISVVDSPTGAKIIGLMVDPNNPSVSIPIPAESVILLRTATGAMLMGGLNNAGRPSYVTSRGALAITKGGSVGLSISGMPANHNGELIIMSTPQSLGSFVVDEHGLFEGQATIPASLPFGTHTLLVSAGGMTIAVGVMVDNPVPMILPATGSNSENPLTAALFWVLFGLGLLMVRRRFRMDRNLRN